ncbi:hypothetical protein LIER_38366 [Lithospermum erythrorhizon]|uniref:Uncharacterized protein n=1 Tax=Lithospermum erythrorhizon TaxID=34254 RepID=A0AAV3Q2T2_LITER
MAKNVVLLVCFVIMILDVIAGVLGIEAEIAQNKVEELRLWILECRDPSNKAFKLGLSATILLCLAHSLASLLGGCICIQSREELDRSSANKQLAFASLILSWIILAIAFTLLISGTMSNSSSRKDCGIIHHRLLSVGGIMCFIHGLLAVAYYISATATAREDTKLNQQGVHA